MNKKLEQAQISILDLVTYPEGGDLGEAFRASRDLARHAERLGYARYWIAEYHNLEGIASSATVVAMGYIAANTERIRVGSGGIMLPNHAPLIVAEQVGTLETMYPGRIDLGLGRAPGTDPLTSRALRRHSTGADFDREVEELVSYFAPARPGQPVKAIPGAGLDIPVWILGSSLYSAHLAAKIGRPYAFASHFAPATVTGHLLTTPWTNAAPSGAWVVQIPPAVAVLIAILLLGGVAYVLGRMRAAQAVTRRVAPPAPQFWGE